MKSSDKAELDSIRKELQAIVIELEDIALGVRANFQGIGNDRCANCIQDVKNQYFKAKRILDNIDITKVTDGYK